MLNQRVAPCSLYARLMGSSWLQVAEPVRAAHPAGSTVRAHGRFRIEQGDSYPAHLLARLLRLPRPSAGADTRLVVTPGDDGEQWRRTFDDRRLDTRQYQAGDGELAERIGFLEFRFRLEATDGSLRFRQVEAALLFGAVRVRLPSAWAPTVEAREDPALANQVRVHVRIALPAVGTVLTYAGTMEIETTRA